MIHFQILYSAAETLVRSLTYVRLLINILFQCSQVSSVCQFMIRLASARGFASLIIGIKTAQYHSEIACYFAIVSGHL